jgi:glycosyltransferase involved in cell wall biosynthesis
MIVLSILKARPGPNGGLLLTQKYVDGVAEYARHWRGPVTTLVDVTTADIGTVLDPLEVFPGRLPFGLEIRPPDDALRERLQNARVVLAFLSAREALLAERCRSWGVPLVYWSEYTLKTEMQIIDADVSNPLRRLVRKARAIRTEQRRRVAVSRSAGIQCSGTPTFQAYAALSPQPLLFFDSRVYEDDVERPERVESRLATLRERRPLRLLFGGRLNRMKGAHHLPSVAAHLTQFGVDFTLGIHGAGPLREQIAADITRLGLGDRVFLRGVSDFRTGWIPTVKTTCDVFVCCHLQGDPSSTYPEVMSCGVPIAGYANEAFTGIIGRSRGGWLTSEGKPRGLAECIARLDRDREEIASASRAALAFAREHAFERTFKERVEHMARCAIRA